VQPVSPFQAATRGPTRGEDAPGTKSAGKLAEELRKRLRLSPGLKDLAAHLRVSDTPEGVRIELVDQADYSMFSNGTSSLDPRAEQLLALVAEVIADVPNSIAIRGHTDATPFASKHRDGPSNNWTLSASRAESTRQALMRAGVDEARFSRLEGVAATDPQIADNPLDPRNRRMSITLLREAPAPP